MRAYCTESSTASCASVTTPWSKPGVDRRLHAAMPGLPPKATTADGHLPRRIASGRMSGPHMGSCRRWALCTKQSTTCATSRTQTQRVHESRWGLLERHQTAFQADGRHQQRHSFVASRRTHVAPEVRIHRKAGILESEAPHRRALAALSLTVATKNTGSFQNHPHTTKTPHRL